MSTDRALYTHSKSWNQRTVLEFLAGFIQRNVQEANATEKSSIFPSGICITFKVLNFPFHHKGIILLYLKRVMIKPHNY